METLKTHLDKEFIQLSEPQEIDKFDVNDVEERFTFLKDLGIKEYKSTFKAWLRKFPRPVFIIYTDDKQLLGWVYGEEWEETARDGEPVYVLRSIEVAEEYREKKLGYRLITLFANETPGYLITKPINEGARRFFLDNGFIQVEDLPGEGIDLRSHPGYVVLPPYKKRKLLEDMDQYFD